jgi:putative chitinase
MPYDRKFFFDTVRNDLFRGALTQDQVDGMEYLLTVWERHFEAANPRDGTSWLSYALATFFHETAERMQPVEEYGKGSGKEYGKPTGPYNKAYYGRGHVQLTWEDNYKKGEKYLKDRYGVSSNIHPDPSKMLHNETSALVSYDGMIHGWFTGVGLPKYFSASIEDPVNARKIVNGLDKADLIAGYYKKFKPALKTVAKAEAPAEVEKKLPGVPKEPAMPKPEKIAEAAAKHPDHHLPKRKTKPA